MPIRNLATHSKHYVTVGELAEYWAVSRQHIYKRIESGTLAAIRLGQRLYRIRTETALAYELGLTRLRTDLPKDAYDAPRAAAQKEPPTATAVQGKFEGWRRPARPG